jgi:stage IV sporulation protein FB
VLVEPGRTPYDLQFSVLGVPVRVHPLFWLVAVLLGSRGIIQDLQPLAQLLLWVAVVFVSILVHEMGHALAIRYFGWQPWVTLYAFGGLAGHERGFGGSYAPAGRRKGDTPTGQVIISFAGPLAGFLLAGLVIAGLYIAGRKMVFPLLAWDVVIGRGNSMYEDNIWLQLAVWYLLWVNIYWGLINLLPVYPLDGGRISRELFTAFSRGDGYQQSLIVSIAFGIGLAVYGLTQDQWWLAILFGLLAYQSYQLLQHHRAGWGGW